MSNEGLLDKIKAFQELLIDYSTGGDVEEEEYERLRDDILSNPKTKEKLPDFVQKCRSLRQFWSFIKSKSGTYEGRRKFIWSKFSPVLNTLEREWTSPADDSIAEVLASLEVGHVEQIWHKALERKGRDPEGAVTAARTLLESVCKSILDEMKVEYDDKADLPKLYHQTADELHLTPRQHSEELFRKILGNCQSVVGTLGAIRNAYSDAHGDGQAHYKPAPRHAELVVNLAGSMAMFLVKTWKSLPEST